MTQIMTLVVILALIGGFTVFGLRQRRRRMPRKRPDNQTFDQDNPFK